MTPDRNARLDVHNSEVPLVCQSCEARHKGICGVLDSAQLVELSRHTTKSEYPAEKLIAADGDRTERYANVLRGVVKLSKLTADGRQQIVGLQFAPDFLGRPFSAQSGNDVECATPVKVCSFPKSILEKLVRESPALEHRLHEQALKELDEARDWMLTLGRKSAAERVASFLYFIAVHIDPEHSGGDGAVKFEIPLKRADIADFLGLTIETISRQLTKLRQAGVILITHNTHIEIPNLGKLRQLTEEDRE
jgi:CRP/FNR family transcriptional regulator, anaerobic regulatory protein